MTNVYTSDIMAVVKGGRMETDTKKNNTVRVPFYDELKKVSEITKYKMSTLLEISWEYFKTTKDYSKLMFGLNKEKGE